MTRYFVDDSPVAIYEFDPENTISDQAPNIIWIKAKMDAKTSSKVKSELFGIAPDGRSAEMYAGNSELGLLIHNIVRWEGPDLGLIPCTREAMEKMDLNQPHIQKVLAEISERNRATPSPNQTSPATSTSTDSGGSDSSLTLQAALRPNQSVSTIPQSRLQQHLAGRLTK